MNIDTPESCMSSNVCNIKDSSTNQQNEALVVARSRKRLRLSAWRRSRKRMRLSSQNTCDENCSLLGEKIIREVFVKLLLDSFGKLSISYQKNVKKVGTSLLFPSVMIRLFNECRVDLWRSLNNILFGSFKRTLKEGFALFFRGRGRSVDRLPRARAHLIGTIMRTLMSKVLLGLKTRDGKGMLKKEV
ncbi:hypothetical protein Tco_1569405 [Tanacetum coccineum]